MIRAPLQSRASQHSGEGEEWERPKKGQRWRVWTGPAPVPPTLTATAYRVRSAAFPEGNAEDKEEEAHFCKGHRAASGELGCRHREPAANRNREGRTDSERQMDRQGHRWAVPFSVMPPLFSVLRKYSASRCQRTEVGMNHFHTLKKMCLRLSFSWLDCPLTVPWLDGSVCSLLCSRQLHIFHIKRLPRSKVLSGGKNLTVPERRWFSTLISLWRHRSLFFNYLVSD